MRHRDLEILQMISGTPCDTAWTEPLLRHLKCCIFHPMICIQGSFLEAVRHGSGPYKHYNRYAAWPPDSPNPMYFHLVDMMAAQYPEERSLLRGPSCVVPGLEPCCPLLCLA
ncbi:hypothetical protein BUE80_DR003708 [Diplocarpon rosae]|nr:hypothetical protein BUE80_DR003708 [Diplocarpon rosae]